MKLNLEVQFNLMVQNNSRKRDLLRFKSQREQLEKARVALVQQVMAWGFFNPMWLRQQVPQPQTDTIYSLEISAYADQWVKVMEGDRLRYYSEEIPEIEAIRQMFNALPEEDRIAAAFAADQKFHYKHPGYDPTHLVVRLTTDALKACWLEEGWFGKKYPHHINKFKPGMSAWLFRPVADTHRFVVFALTEDEARAVAKEWTFDNTSSPYFVDWLSINCDCLGKTFTQGKAVEIMPHFTWDNQTIGTYYLVKKENISRILSEKQLHS